MLLPQYICVRHAVEKSLLLDLTDLLTPFCNLIAFFFCLCWCVVPYFIFFGDTVSCIAPPGVVAFAAGGCVHLFCGVLLLW